MSPGRPDRGVSMSVPNEVLVIGSSNTDMVFTTERLPTPGETVLGKDFFVAPGGKGANQAVAAARAGAKVSFIACLGDDSFGKQALGSIESEGIDTQHVTIATDQVSGVAAILVDQGGENTIVVAPGANSLLKPKMIEKAKSAFDRAAICLLQLESPIESVKKAIDMAWQRNIPVILNPAPAANLPSEIYEKLFLITPNESETEQLTDIRPDTDENTSRAAKLLLQKGVGGVGC